MWDGFDKKHIFWGEKRRNPFCEYKNSVAPCMNMITHMCTKLRKCQKKLDHYNLDTFIHYIRLNVLSASSLHHLNI